MDHELRYYGSEMNIIVCAHFIGSDLLKLTREDLVQICGPADGIRLYNALKSK